jgi:hypothetical protein
LRSGHLAVLVFDRPTADGEVRDELPMELGLVDRAPQDEVIDVSNKAYAEPPLDWRLVPNPAMILKLFPAKPTSDDLLDLFELSRKLRSNLLEQRVRKLTPV